MTKNKSIVSRQEIILPDNFMTPEQLDALTNFAKRQIPEANIDTRIAPGGKSLQYVKHSWVTGQMQSAFRSMWSWEVLDWEVFDEILAIKGKEVPSRSVVARTKLTINWVINPALRQHSTDPWFYQQVMTDVGTYHKEMASMPTAYAVASAASRALCKCVMRATGLGIQFYETDDLDPKTAWNALRKYVEGTKNKEWTDATRNRIAEHLKANGLSNWPDDLVDKFGTAFDLVAAMFSDDHNLDDVPMDG